MTAPIRSFLFIPGDSEKKLGKADSTGADALILDLEDSVAPPNKARAREMVTAFLMARPREQRTSQLWVRVNPLDTDLLLGDLAAVVAGGAAACVADGCPGDAAGAGVGPTHGAALVASSVEQPRSKKSY